MTTILQSNAEITERLASTIAELQASDNEYINMYTSHCDDLLTLLFENGAALSPSDPKNEIFDLTRKTHELRLILESLKAPLNPQTKKSK